MMGSIYTSIKNKTNSKKKTYSIKPRILSDEEVKKEELVKYFVNNGYTWPKTTILETIKESNDESSHNSGACK